MYKQKNKTCLKKVKQVLYWLKTKALIIITAFMLGVSNSINDENKSVFGNEVKTEQQDKKD